MVLGIAFDATAERRAGEVVSRPGGLPWRKKIPARFAQRGPFCPVGHLRYPKHDALARDRGYQFRHADSAEEGHAMGFKRRARDDGNGRPPGFRRLFVVLSPLTSRRLTGETVCNRRGAFKPSPRTERGDSGPAAGNQRPAGGAGAFDRYGFDLSDEFVERNGPTPVEHLARKLLCPRAGTLERHQ